MCTPYYALFVLVDVDRVDDPHPGLSQQGRRRGPARPQVTQRRVAGVGLVARVEVEFDDDVLGSSNGRNTRWARTPRPRRSIGSRSNAAFHMAKSFTGCSSWSVGIRPLISLHCMSSESTIPLSDSQCPSRSASTRATRRKILQAAQEHFERDGYAAASMAAIAATAGVSLKTVYLVFETKANLLRALWHLLLRGDRDTVPVGQQDWYREVLDEPDPRARAAPEPTQLAGGEGPGRPASGGDPRRRPRGPRHRHALAADPGRVPRQPARGRRSIADRGGLDPGTTSNWPPTSCGRSTIRASTRCWPTSAAGHPSATSAGSASCWKRTCSPAEVASPATEVLTRVCPVTVKRAHMSESVPRG